MKLRKVSQYRMKPWVVVSGLFVSAICGGATAAESAFQFTETAELSREALLQELIAIEERAAIESQRHRGEVSDLQARCEHLQALEEKGYASPAEIEQAQLDLEREKIQAESFEQVFSMAHELGGLVSTGEAGPAPKQEVSLNLSLPVVSIDLAGIRLLGLSRPADEEFAQTAFDYLQGKRENVTNALGFLEPDGRLEQLGRILEFPGARPGEIRNAEREIANMELSWKLSRLDNVKADRDLQRLEQFGRFLALNQDGKDLPCAFPVLSEPLFLDAGKNVLPVELNADSLAVALPVAVVYAAYDGPVRVQQALADDAERKRKWIELAYERGAASVREREEARLACGVAREVLNGMKAELEARQLGLTRLEALARETGIQDYSDILPKKGVPSVEDRFTEIRNYWSQSSRPTTVMLSVVRRFEASAEATANRQQAELEQEWSQSRLAKHLKVSKLRPSELERLESRCQLAEAKRIEAAQSEQLRALELQQWMKAAELPRNPNGDAEISAEVIRLAEPIAEANICAATHYLAARELEKDFRRDLLAELEDLHQRGKARDSEVITARQILAIANGRSESAERKVRIAQTGAQLVASLMESSGDSQTVNLARSGGATMQLVAELCHEQLRPDPGLVAELQARQTLAQIRCDKLADLAARGDASNQEVVRMKAISNHYAVALALNQGVPELGELRSELVQEGLQLDGLLPVSGVPAK